MYFHSYHFLFEDHLPTSIVVHPGGNTVTSRCVRRSVMSACGHNGTPGTSRCVRRSVMSAMDFHRSVVSACGHNGTTGTSRYVRRSIMSADNFRDLLYLEYTPSKTYFSMTNF